MNTELQKRFSAEISEEAVGCDEVVMMEPRSKDSIPLPFQGFAGDQVPPVKEKSQMSSSSWSTSFASPNTKIAAMMKNTSIDQNQDLFTTGVDAGEDPFLVVPKPVHEPSYPQKMDSLVGSSHMGQQQCSGRSISPKSTIRSQHYESTSGVAEAINDARTGAELCTHTIATDASHCSTDDYHNGTWTLRV